MIAGLIGNVYSKNGSSVLFNVNGVIYEVFMSINAIANLKDGDTLLITQITRDDGSFLSGFVHTSEKDLVDILKNTRQHLMNGVSHMIPVVVSGGILFAIAAMLSMN